MERFPLRNISYIIQSSILSKTDAIMSEESNDFRKKPIPSGRFWEALKATLEIFGPAMKEATILELQKNGIDPENKAQEHTLAELGDKLSSIFGVDGTEVIIDQIAKRLRT